MLGMMGVAGLVQGKIKDSHLFQAFIGIEILMALLGGFAPIAIYAAFGFVTDHFLVVHYFFVLSIGFLIGFEIPIVMRIIDLHGTKIKANLKIVFALDYIGGFIGAIIWIKLLLPNFPLSEISFIVAGFNFFIAIIAILYFIRKGMIKRKRVFIIGLLIIAVSALYYGYSNNRNWNLSMEQKFYEDPITYRHTTKYQHLVLTEHKQSGDIRLYINGNTQFSSLDEDRYHDLLVHPVMALNPKARNVLILGGGDGLALREVLKYPNVESVTLADLDPEMVKFASTNPLMKKLNKGSFHDARVYAHKSNGVSKIGVKGVYIETGRLVSKDIPETEFVAQVDVYNVDADKFVGELHMKQWDVIIIDFPDPSSVELAKLYSKEFYIKLQSLMTPNTVISIQSTSPYHAKEAYLTIQRTMNAAGLKTIPYRQNIPSFGDWGYFLSWNSDISVKEMKNNIHKIEKFQIETEFLTPELLKASLAFGKGELTTKETCINILMQPCLLDKYAHDSWKID